jgi:hypothetical protein
VNLHQRTVSLERISDLIGGIYDCVLDPGRWSVALAAICQEFDFASSILGILRLPAGAHPFQASVGVEPQWLARIGEYGPDLIAIWGGIERVQQYPLDEPILTSEAVGRAAMRENRYFREWVQPQGIADAAAIAVARDQTMIGNVSFGRHELPARSASVRWMVCACSRRTFAAS